MSDRAARVAAAADRLLRELGRLRELPGVDEIDALPAATPPVRARGRRESLRAGAPPIACLATRLLDHEAAGASRAASDPADLTLVEAAHWLRTGRVSAEELTQACLTRIERRRDLNAFATVTAEAARRAARRADRERRAGRDRGPLHGIPIGHKDVFWTRGIRTAAGSRILADFVPDRDATAVRRLRGAGTVLLGKLQTHEFAYGSTCDSAAFGPVLNPWDPTRSPGGSSGGTAAAVAAGLVFGGTGTDTGGSVRIPGAWCGVAGLKPTREVVSRQGIVPLSPSLDHVGPLARTVRDVALLFRALIDPRGPHSRGERALARRPEAPAASPAARSAPPLAGVVLGVPAEHFWDHLDPEVDRLVRAALARLEHLGARLAPVSLPHVAYAHLATLAIMLAEGARTHARWLRERPDDYGEDVRVLLELGRAVPAPDYLCALRAREVLRAEVDGALDAVTALVAPTMPVPAARHGTRSVRIGDHTESVGVAAWRLTHPFNLTGHPALQVPVGFTAEGLPVGMQVIGPWFGEATILGIGLAYEADPGWAPRRPPEPQPPAGDPLDRADRG